MSHVLIVGASRGIGLAAVEAALAAGHTVRALARSAASIALDDARLEKMSGDARDPDDVRRALDGVDAVVLALGVAANAKMLTGPIDLFSAATEVLVPAMREAGVRRLVCVTGFGAGDSDAAISPLQRLPFHLVFGRAYADKSRQEEIIKNSGLDWTLVRPGVLTNGRATGRYRVRYDRREWRNGVISRRDVADYIVKALADDATIGRAPVLTG